MKNFLNQASNAVKSAHKSVSDTVTDTTRQISFVVDSNVQGARDKALNAATTVTETASAVCQGFVGSATVLVELGVVVAAVAAPVPTLIGVGLIWLLQDQLSAVKDNAAQQILERRKQRNFERVSGLLKKHGKIPEMAVLQTSLIKMIVNSRTGEVSGRVLSGDYQGRELAQLTDQDIGRLLAFAPDDDTKTILEAYQSLREAQAGQA